MQARRDDQTAVGRIRASDAPEIDADAERSADDADGEEESDLVAPLDVPFETPVADLIDQRRSVPFDDADGR